LIARKVGGVGRRLYNSNVGGRLYCSYVRAGGCMIVMLSAGLYDSYVGGGCMVAMLRGGYSMLWGNDSYVEGGGGCVVLF
jgi:hypothetical protein